MAGNGTKATVMTSIAAVRNWPPPIKAPCSLASAQAAPVTAPIIGMRTSRTAHGQIDDVAAQGEGLAFVAHRSPHDALVGDGRFHAR